MAAAKGEKREWHYTTATPPKFHAPVTTFCGNSQAVTRRYGLQRSFEKSARASDFLRQHGQRTERKRIPTREAPEGNADLEYLIQDQLEGLSSKRKDPQVPSRDHYSYSTTRLHSNNQHRQLPLNNFPSSLLPQLPQTYST